MLSKVARWILTPRVPAWICSRCGAIHDTHAEATVCCRNSH
jgi:hypothetical protein